MRKLSSHCSIRLTILISFFLSSLYHFNDWIYKHIYLYLWMTMTPLDDDVSVYHNRFIHYSLMQFPIIFLILFCNSWFQVFFLSSLSFSFFIHLRILICYHHWCQFMSFDYFKCVNLVSAWDLLNLSEQHHHNQIQSISFLFHTIPLESFFFSLVRTYFLSRWNCMLYENFSHNLISSQSISSEHF